jgi:hypothetical protein
MKNNQNTQLPAEVQQKIHSDTNQLYDQLDSAVREVDSYHFGLPMYERQTEPIRNLLTEYATKLHQVEQENEILKRWRDEAIQLLNPIWDYAENNLNVPLGGKKTDAVINHAQKATDLIQEALVHIEYLENKFNAITGSGNNLKSRLQTFLDGTK